MKQLLQNMRDGKASVVEVPVPQLKPGVALVRNATSLVSAGTERMVVAFAEKNLVGKARSRPDLVKQVLRKARQEGILPTIQAAFNRLDQPMALGYSSAGEVVAVGEGLEGIKVGDRVACAGQGFASHAEFVIVPKNLLTCLPEGVDYDSAAFTTLGAIALQGIRLAETQLGENVVVIGLGLLGLLTVQMVKASGCRVLGVDIDPKRVELARQLGVDAIERKDAQDAGLGYTKGMGFDAVLICADTKSNDPVELAGELARDRARVVAVGAVGMDIPRRAYYGKELSLIVSRSYGPGRYDPTYEEKGIDYPLGYVRWTEGRNLEAFVSLVAEGKVDVKPLISHRIPIERGVEAYDLITGKQNAPFMGVLLTYPEAVDCDSGKILQIPGTKKLTGQDAITVGVLGSGSFANAVFLPAMKKAGGVRLKTIVSASGLNAQHSARKYGFENASSSEDAALGDPDINTVVLLTRHNEHTRQAIAALDNDKHVYCEKPPALTQEELDFLFKALQKENAPLFTVGYNRRFSPMATALKQFFKDRHEAVWMHYRVNAGYIPLTHWLHQPEGGGRIIGEGCHFIDFLTFLVGSPPATVSAVGLPDGERYQEDNVSLTLTFRDGSIGTVSYLANGDRSLPKERLEVFCAGKSAVLDDYRRLDLIAGGRNRKMTNPAGKGHFQAWRQFLAAIESGTPPIPYEHIYGVSLATFAAVESLHTQEVKQITFSV